MIPAGVLEDWVSYPHSACFSAAFLVVVAAAEEDEVALVVAFFPLVDLLRLPRFLPPGVALPDSVAGFLLLVFALAGCFLAAGF